MTELDWAVIMLIGSLVLTLFFGVLTFALTHEASPGLFFTLFITLVLCWFDYTFFLHMRSLL